MLIYRITFPNRKVYIGQTIETINTRMSHHKTDAKLERDKTEFSPSGSKICNAIRKYGLELEWVDILDTANSIEELNDKEIYWIEQLNSLKNGYNTKPGGGNKEHSEETKIKIGNATKERWKDPEVAARMLEGLKKGVQVMKERKGEIRVERIIKKCELCGEEFESRPAENRKFCSQKCASKHASNIASEKKKEEYQILSENKKTLIENWALENKELILKCPLNKISTNLEPLLKLTELNDWRSLTKIIGETSRKEFLIYLKNFVKIYAEPDGN